MLAQDHVSTRKILGRGRCNSGVLAESNPNEERGWHDSYEAWYGRKPSAAHLRTFGCVGFVKNVGRHLSKLEVKSTPIAFFGYDVCMIQSQESECFKGCR